MAHSDQPTVRLYNNGPVRAQVSLRLAKYADKSGGRLRRGLQTVPALIAHNGYLDVCAHLGVDLAEAERILDQSSDVTHHIANRQLLRARYPEEAPPTPPVALPPAPPLAASPAPPEPPPVPLMPSALEAAAKLFAEPAPPEAEPVAPPEVEPMSTSVEELAVSDPAEVESPDSTWPHAKLVEYAKAHGIDPTGSKTVLLKRIRKETT